MRSPVLFDIAHTWDAAPAAPNERATVSVSTADDGLTVTIDAPFHDDPAPPEPPGPRDGLWAFEVVEFFLVGPEETYLEVEIGPHGHHLVLLLRGRRQAHARCLPLDVAVERAGDRWRATANLPATWLPPRPWTANAFAIHGLGEARRYLCATPTGGPQPDFHRLETFAPFDPR